LHSTHFTHRRATPVYQRIGGIDPSCSYYLTRAASEIAAWFKAKRFDGLVAAAKRKIVLKLFLRSGSRFESLSQDHAGKLYELFRPEVEELESLLNRDFSTWKSGAVQASGMQVAA
jgi:hypothetical protein